MADERNWRQAAARRFAVPLVIAVAGAVVVALGSGTTRAAGWGVIAIAITIAVSLAFLEVGYSEDRARRKEADERDARRGGRG